eukprot:scaffold387242_cov42-Prasinocladus_malaysianus.AAC.1
MYALHWPSGHFTTTWLAMPEKYFNFPGSDKELTVLTALEYAGVQKPHIKAQQKGCPLHGCLYPDQWHVSAQPPHIYIS